MDRVQWKTALLNVGISQGELARRIGISEKALSLKATGKNDFRLGEVQAICKELNIDDPREIFFEK